jgi:hypothetical protein
MADDNPERDSGLRKQGARLGKIVILNLISRLLYLILFIDILILAFALGTGGSFGGGQIGYFVNLAVDVILLPVLIYAIILVRSKRKSIRSPFQLH